MALTDYTFKLGDNGIVLNAPTTEFPFVDIEEVRGLDSAPFRETTRDHEGTDGGFMDAEFEKARPIILEGTIYDDPGHLEIFLDDLKANYAPSTTLVPFYLKAPNQIERVLFVKPQGVRYDWDVDRRLGLVRAQFMVYAEDPRLYDNLLQSMEVPLSGVAQDGFEFPLEFPFGFGEEVEKAGGATLTNLGNRPTHVEMIIHGPIIDPRIINDRTGEMMRFNITLGADDFLRVNTYYRTVILNDFVNRRSALIDPYWLTLLPGDTDIRYVAGGLNQIAFGTVPLNANPFFEEDVLNWNPLGATISHTTLQAHQGVASMSFIPDGVSSFAQVDSELVPIKPGLTYKVSAWLRITEANVFKLKLLWYDSSSVFLSSSSLDSNLSSPDVWTLAEAQFQAPTNAAFASIQVQLLNTPPSTITLFIDEAMILPPVTSFMTINFRSAWR